MRSRFCKVCRGWHDMDEPWPHNCLPERPQRADHLPAPMIIQDGLDYVWNPIDGKHYSSKAKYYSAVKAKGCEIAGNDSSVMQPKRKEITAPTGLKQDIVRAIRQHS